MTRPRSIFLGTAIVLAAVWWSGALRGEDDGTADQDRAGADPQDRSTAAANRARTGLTGIDRAGRSWTAPQRLDGAVTIAGTVIDTQSSLPVGSVEVVFRSALGEETAMAGNDGTYHIDVPAGVYRAFVRDDTVLSVGTLDHVRLPGPPTAETVGMPEEALMPTVVASRDTEGVDLSVMRGGAVTGHVVDRAGRPIKHAVLRARTPTGIKPTLGTDVAETDDTGAFEMRLPAGDYELEATHPRYAGVVEAPQISVAAGDHVTADVTLTAGCVIAGRVVGPGGTAGDGAIEQQWGQGELEFSPAGRIASDGTFRWVTTEETEVTLRAWPWKAPPSPGRRFACRDGARFESVVFEIPDQRPDIDGVLVDASGGPVAFAFIDLAPLDPGGISQQERTDADGKWGVFHMPTGRYRITAHAPGRGVVSTTVSSPQTQVTLALGGTGHLEGTTTLLANGSFEMRLVACVPAVAIPDDRRLVSVVGGHFKLDDVPACDLRVISTWHGHPVASRVTVPADGTAHLELAIGPPHAKQIHGIVRDDAGHPIAGASIFAAYEELEEAPEVTATTDGAGRYSITTVSGATLFASLGTQHGVGAVSMTNADTEQVDLVLREEVDEPENDEPAGDEEGFDDEGGDAEPELVN
ncbi:MAG: signal protein [Deltaproteobacteria bacterium]|nr:signal protein [Deltaproteobacteria bacterium]